MSEDVKEENYLVKIKYKSGFEEIRALPACCVEKMKGKKYDWGELSVIKKLTDKENGEIIEMEKTCLGLFLEELEGGEKYGE